MIPAISRATRSAPPEPCIWSLQHDLGRPGGVIGGGGAHVGGGLGLGKGDLGLGLLGAPRDEVVHALGRVLGELFGLGARFGDDRGGVRFRFGGLFLEARQQRGRFRAQPFSLVELGLDRFAAGVEPLQDDAVGADVDQHPDEDEKAEQDEKFGVDFHHASPLAGLIEATAAATAAGSAGRPPSRSTIAPAASRAISDTLVIAWARV